MNDKLTWPWPHFSKSELACPCCGTCRMDEFFMFRLEAFRLALGTPIHINSAYRCALQEKKVGGSGANHPKGGAIDFSCGLRPSAVVLKALNHGFSVGIRAHGDRDRRFFHIDTVHDGQVLWSYA